MKKYSRVLAGILAVLLSAGCTGLYAAAQSDSSSAADSTASTTKSESDKKDTKDTKKADKSDSDTEKQAKEETVYVITDASGNKTKTVVSNWLKNPQGVKKLEDVSDLKDIENVKTDEGFTANGDKLTWDTEGGDIYYKGYTDKALPVDVKVTYTLDGKEIKPEDLAGKSGKLTVRYDYTNNDKKTVKINGKKTDIYVPYLMATTAILDTNVYSNVEVTNGKLISDGSRQILIGVAMPGLTKSLDLQDNEDIEIPEYVEFTADVKDFESTTSLTVATSDIFSKLDLSDIGDADDLQDKLDELSDATDELVDGTAKLYAGIKKLSDSSGTLITGIDKLYSGSKSLDCSTCAAFAASISSTPASTFAVSTVIIIPLLFAMSIGLPPSSTIALNTVLASFFDTFSVSAISTSSANSSGVKLMLFISISPKFTLLINSPRMNTATLLGLLYLLSAFSKKSEIIFVWISVFASISEIPYSSVYLLNLLLGISGSLAFISSS